MLFVFKFWRMRINRYHPSFRFYAGFRQRPGERDRSQHDRAHHPSSWHARSRTATNLCHDDPSKCNGRARIFCVVFMYRQGRNEVRWRPGQEARSATPCLNLRSFGSNCTVLKKLLLILLGLFGALHSDSALGELCPPCSPLVTPLYIGHRQCSAEWSLAVKVFMCCALKVRFLNWLILRCCWNLAKVFGLNDDNCAFSIQRRH